MKILYLHQYFLTPEQGGAVRSYHLAKSLVDNGHEVIMITAHNHLNYHFENIQGIKVHYLPIYYENNLSKLGRIISFIKFILKAYQKAKEVDNIDLCYATSTPLTIGLIALWLKRFQKINYYFEVRDLWPEAPIQLGIVKNYFVKKYLYYLERKIYRNATKIIGLSPGIIEGIKKVAPTKEIYLLPNFSDCDFFTTEIKNDTIEAKFNVKDKFVISYFGAIGKANHLEYLIQAAELLHIKNNEKIHFVIAGKGSELVKIKEMASKSALSNISFVGFLTKNSIKELLNCTDAIYISFNDIPILETNSPNKFFDGLAAGKVCITNTKGWIKELIEQHKCGFYYPGEDPEKFVELIEPYSQDKNMLLEAQKNARRLAENEFDKTLIYAKFNRLF